MGYTKVITATNTAYKLRRIRGSGFAFLFFWKKTIFRKVDLWHNVCRWMLNQIFRGSPFNRKDSREIWG